MTASVFNYSETYKVRSYETDMNACVTIQSIVNYLQNSGFNHALVLRKAGGLSHDPHTAYFLTRQRVKMFRYPKWQETITLNTWLEPRVREYAVREFELLDEEGNIIGCATNSAVFYHLGEKRVIPAWERMERVAEPERGRALDDPFDPLPRPSKAEFSSEFRIRIADIDMYRHVNNMMYVEWAIETLPDQVWEDCTLFDHEINFRSETSPGDVIVAEAEEVEGGDMRVFLHRLTRRSDGKEVALLRTWWEKGKKQEGLWKR
ncbi:MAG TPA: thioesterase [Spirochaetota bacterium]|nr:thioesterase [Spirochaetota bacterium]HPJ34797.1 thioesterase [Spirochaetota bacterium]